MRMRRRLSAVRALTWRMESPSARAACSALWSSSTLAALGTSSGRIRTSWGRSTDCRVTATSLTPPPPPRAAAAAASAAVRRPFSERSEVWAKPVVSPRTTRMPAPRSSPEVSSSTRPSSSRADELRLSSANTSANSPPLRNAAPRTRWRTDSSIIGRLPPIPGSPGRWGAPYPTDVGVQPGLAAMIELVVKEGDTAEALRSGDVPMLATPRVVALAEEATVAALAGHLEDKATTVGQRVQLDHLLPIPVGVAVRAEAKLESVEGRRLVFTFSVNSDRGLVAAGKIHRVIVIRDRFIEKANE